MRRYSYFLISRRPNRKRLAETLGANVRELRLEQGLSITKLSYISKISRALIREIERGTSDVRLSYVERLAAALCVDAEQLFVDFEQDGGPRFLGY